MAGEVFYEVILGPISFESGPVYFYMTMTSISFLLCLIVIIVNIIVLVAVQFVHSAGGAKAALIIKMKPLVAVAHRCCILSTLVWASSLLVWGPMKFPPFSMITYTLPALSLLLMAQQLHDIRQRCLKCAAVEDANHSLQEQEQKLLHHQQT